MGFQVHRYESTRPSQAKMNKNTLKQIHSHSFRNEAELKKSHKAGCFYCVTTFTPSDIVDWLDETDVIKNTSAGKRTALCPFCGIDSVLGNAADYEVTKTLLVNLKEEFFTCSAVTREELDQCSDIPKSVKFIDTP